jgi:hypothetical protein
MAEDKGLKNYYYIGWGDEEEESNDIDNFEEKEETDDKTEVSVEAGGEAGTAGGSFI